MQCTVLIRRCRWSRFSSEGWRSDRLRDWLDSQPSRFHNPWTNLESSITHCGVASAKHQLMLHSNWCRLATSGGGWPALVVCDNEGFNKWRQHEVMHWGHLVYRYGMYIALHFMTQGRRSPGASELSEKWCQCAEGVLATTRKGSVGTYSRAASVLMMVQ